MNNYFKYCKSICVACTLHLVTDIIYCSNHVTILYDCFPKDIGIICLWNCSGEFDETTDGQQVLATHDRSNQRDR